jgi:hypothetical protein
MVAQLVKNELGVYEYVEVDTKPKSNVSSMEAFEAYEGQKKKTELVSAPSIGEQTEKVIRETPGLNRTEFDESTGQFVTRSTIPGKEITYTPGEVTPESTEPTALQKVMKMTEGRTVAEPDYKKIISDAARASRPTWKEQAISSAFDVGGKVLTNYITKKMTGSAGDLAVNYMTQNVLGKTLSGRLATGGMLTNPYVAGAGLLMQSGVGKDIAKGVGKVATEVIDVVGDTASSVWKAVTGDSVICTELNRQGFISNEDYKIHWNYTLDKWNKDELKGYWIWAMPTAKKMKTNKWLTKFWLHIMKYKIQHVKHTLGKAKFTLRGYIYNLLVEQISLLISKLIKKKKTKEVLA